MADRYKNSNHTGKTQRTPDDSVTFDSNMIGYLYVLSSPHLTLEEHTKIKKVLTGEQYRIIMDIIDNNFQDNHFRTTPQIICEIIAYAKAKRDRDAVNFLAKLCKTRIPKSMPDKIKYAELIADLMEDYIVPDIALSTGVTQMQSAIAGEYKNGVPNFADAKIAAENNVLNGCPLVTRNEKHLVAMNVVKIRNNLRSEAILKKNRAFLKSHKTLIPNKTVRMHLSSKKATTFRISDFPHIKEM